MKRWFGCLIVFNAKGLRQDATPVAPWPTTTEY